MCIVTALGKKLLVAEKVGGNKNDYVLCFVVQSLYRSMDLMFLTDDTDTILAYEERGRENKPTVSSYESGIQALQNMGRIPQVEVIQGRSEECNSMKSR